MADETHPDTTDRDYTERLVKLTGAGWKQRLDVQRPYRWNLRRLTEDRRVLDVGCGIGRNLTALNPESVGVDHNRYSVDHCRSLGLHAYTPGEFRSVELGKFDGMLMAHVIEHLTPGAEAQVIKDYLPHLAPGAVVLLLCPQERGFASDITHTTFFEFGKLSALCEQVGLTVTRTSSFPFPRFAGGYSSTTSSLLSHLLHQVSRNRARLLALTKPRSTPRVETSTWPPAGTISGPLGYPQRRGSARKTTAETNGP